MDDVTILHGDALTMLRTLPDCSVHCVVTSPPYWGLRDYGTAIWEGGDAKCDHKLPDDAGQTDKPTVGQREHAGRFSGAKCWRCGALRIDCQIGLEPTLDAYVARLVEVFREVRRVLRDDGTLWLNLGDSYYGGKGSNGSSKARRTADERGYAQSGGTVQMDTRPLDLPQDGLKPKDLVGIPWRVAFALQADGWYLRSDIIWAKPDPMPESVMDRPTKSHEYIFLLAKQERYYFDNEAIKEPAKVREGKAATFERTGAVSELILPGQSAAQHRPNRNGKNAFRGQGANRDIESGKAHREGRDVTDTGNGPTRNKRTVWTVATQPYSGAHFAVFPPELVKPCILAGTSEWGVCQTCGAPWKRVVERKSITPWDERVKNGALSGSLERGCNENHGRGMSHELGQISITTGWQPTCNCQPAKPVSATVLDPFMGSGTTLAVAVGLGRRGIGIELNASYIEMMLERIGKVQRPLLL